MADIPMVRNPLGWAQMILLGGWRRVWGVAAIYAAAVLMFSVMIYRAIEIPMSSFAQGGMSLIILTQSVFYYIVALGQIKKCILRDFTSDMITSHRLSAMSGYTAVLGYMTGPLSQVFAMTVVNWLVCNVFMSMMLPSAGMNMASPSVLFAIMTCLALPCWSLGVLMGLATRGKSTIIGLLVLIGLAGNSSMIAISPGLSLMVPLVSLSSYSPTAVAGLNPASFLVSMLVQSILTLTFFVAAARKFQRDDVPGFTPAVAHVLLAICTLTSAVAFKFFRPDMGRLLGQELKFVVDPGNQMIVTLALLGLLSCLPIAATADAEARWRRRFSADPIFAPRRPWPFYAGPIVASTVVLGTLYVVCVPAFKTLMAETMVYLSVRDLGAMGAAFFFAMLSMSGLLRVCYGIGMRGLVMGVMLLVMLWLIPLLADVAWAVLNDRDSIEGESILFTISPIGTWIAVLKNLDSPVGSGLIVQGIIAAVMLALAVRVRRRAYSVLRSD